jgi:hypothetical protein
MPWYKAGTVSVTQNSNAVIGSGTAFIANARVGDAFRGPDGGWYEVTNIASDAALSIAPIYQGATNASGAYALAPMQGYVKDSADALRALVNQFGGVLAVLGQTPTTAGVRAALNLTNTDGLPEGSTNKYMTASGVRAITLSGIDVVTPGAVASTDSILLALGKLQATKADLSGTNKTVSIAQGGTGAATVVDARTALGLKKAALADIVGTVSQSSGVPTGSIIEPGTTANGTFTKFADGTMICRSSTVYASTSILAVAGAVFNGSPAPSQVYPAAFVGVPATNQYFEPSTGQVWAATTGVSTSSLWSAVYPFSQVQVSSLSLTLHRIAYGRWF